MYKIVFIGSNPSQRSASIVPFYYDTKSMTVLNKWMEQMHAGGSVRLESVHFLNVSNAPTPGNRPLTVGEITNALIGLEGRISAVNPDKIITLGKTAEKALTLLRMQHYAMPHPSGLNRLLNDKEYVTEKINGLRDYLSPSKID